MSREQFKVGFVSGGPRSGKGELGKYFAKKPEVATDETGADYRAVTKALLERGILDPEMDRSAISKALGSTATNDFIGFAASSHAIKAEHGLQSLYAPDVASLVHHVAQHPELRSAIKAGFQERIRAIRDGGDHELLIVDGRNLESTIEAVEDTELFMRLFLECSPEEAALRECAKNKIDITSEEGQIEYAAALARIKERQMEDLTRANDPVRPDDNAIDYWDDYYLRLIKATGIAIEQGTDLETAMDTLAENPKSHLRRGAGVLARRLGRQVRINTDLREAYPDDPIAPMLKIADTILDESLSTKPIR